MATNFNNRIVLTKPISLGNRSNNDLPLDIRTRIESIDEVFGATETDKIVQDIIDEYNETLKDLGSEADVEQIRKKLFTNKLDKMYK